MFRRLLALSFIFWISSISSISSYTVKEDMGGPIEARLAQIKDMDGVRIEGLCYSACTLYLGLPKTCVTPNAKLGFHSPFWRLADVKMPLPRKEWDRVTKLMASHYPQPMRKWWMEEARYSTEIVPISGKQAVAMGAKACQS